MKLFFEMINQVVKKKNSLIANASKEINHQHIITPAPLQ